VIPTTINVNINVVVDPSADEPEAGPSGMQVTPTGSSEDDDDGDDGPAAKPRRKPFTADQLKGYRKHDGKKYKVI